MFCINFFFLIKVICCNFSRICRGFGSISLPSHGSVFCSRKEKSIRKKKILDSGTRASLDSYCHLQIVHCKVNFRIPPPFPFERKIWHFNRENAAAIKRSMNSFPWRQHLNTNTNPNWQVKTFNDIFLNIMSNFIPNGTKRFVPRDHPWITKSLKTILNRKYRLFKNYKKHSY